MLRGTEDARQIVYDFLRKYTREPPPKGRDHYIVRLTSEITAEGAEPLQEIPFKADDDLASIAADVMNACEDACEEIGTGKVTFTVRIVDHRTGRRTFSLYNEDDEEDAEAQRYQAQPTERGVIAQLMRHLETRERTMLQKELRIDRMTARMLDQLNGRVQSLERGRLETFELAEDLRDRRAERDLKALEQENSEKRKDKMLRVLGPLAGTAVNMIAKRTVIPTAAQGIGNVPATPLESLIHALFHSLTEEQAQALVDSGILSMDQLLILKQARDEIAARDARAEAEAEAARGADANGAAGPAAYAPDDDGIAE